MKTAPTFSVVIPCLNEEKYIGDVLGDVTRQTRQPKEVIVSDCRSSDRTIEMAQKFQDNLPLEVITSKVRSPGAARNAGAKRATTDYIIFIDADMRLPKTAFEQTLEATHDGMIDYITPLFSTPGHHPIDQLAVKIINFDIRLGVTVNAHLPGIGGYMCVRRKCHQSLNGFLEDGRSEDIDYLARLKKQGVSCAVLKSLVIETSNRRLAKDGRFVSALHFIPQRWHINRRVIQPLLKKAGKEKKFGEF